jgi:hypothetical protein
VTGLNWEGLLGLSGTFHGKSQTTSFGELQEMLNQNGLADDGETEGDGALRFDAWAGWPWMGEAFLG